VWRLLRSKQLDAALCSNHYAYYPDLVLVSALGIPNRVAFVHKGLSGLVTHPVTANFPQPAPAYFRSMVATLDNSVPDWPLDPVVHLTEQDRVEADAAIRGLSLDQQRITVACVMTIRQKATHVWPAERYLAALSALEREMPLQVVFCGSRADAPLLRSVAERASFPCHVLAGTLRLRALAAFLSRCDGLLAADSGPRHIANAVGTPVAFIRSLSAQRIESGRYTANEIDLAPEGDYLGLEQQAAKLAEIDPQVVARTFAELITQRARSSVESRAS
jgi:ADP-heptose:LPS heptosyltransferase